LEFSDEMLDEVIMLRTLVITLSMLALPCVHGIAQDMSLAHETASLSAAQDAGHPYDRRCNECLYPSERRPLTRLEASGFRGRPYLETQPGSCRCGKPLANTRVPNVNNYWPRPFSAALDMHHSANCVPDGSSLTRTMNAPFDPMQGYPGPIRYQRCDDGYCGSRLGFGRDPYGCVGETRAQYGIYGSAAGIVGLGVRDPGAPIAR
jgi:hypothetical protein